MTGQPSKLHPLWEIADKRCDKSTTQQAVYRIRPNCFLLVNKDGEILTVVVETRDRKNVPLSRECFTLYADGSLDHTTWAEVESGLTERIDVVMLKMPRTTYSAETLGQTSGIGVNRMKIQLDELSKRLSSRHLRRVDFYDRRKIIPKSRKTNNR